MRKKATVYAQDLAADGSPSQGGIGKIDVDGVVELYEHYIIPLTKEVEVRVCFLGRFPRSRPVDGQVDYLLQRLDGLSDEQIEELIGSTRQS